MAVDLSVFGNLKTKADYDRAEEEFQLRKQLQQAQIAATQQKENAFDLDKLGEQVLFKAASGQPLTPQEMALGKAYDAKRNQVYTDEAGNIVSKPPAFGGLYGGNGPGNIGPQGQGSSQAINTPYDQIQPSQLAPMDLASMEGMTQDAGQGSGVSPGAPGVDINAPYKQSLGLAAGNPNATQKVIEARATLPLDLQQKQAESDISVNKAAQDKYNAALTNGNSIIYALDEFAKGMKTATTKDRMETVAGIPTVLGTNYQNAALLAKGEALYDLGVLNGPDLKLLRGALADPSTVFGSMAKTEKIDAQVASIKALITKRLEEFAKRAGATYQPDAGKPRLKYNPATGEFE